MKDDLGPSGEQFAGDAGLGEIGDDVLDVEAGGGRGCGRNDIRQHGV
jgi:hypothetical protein